MMSVKKYLILCIIIIFILPPNIANPENIKTAPLRSLIEEALNNNPEVQASLKEWEAAKYKIDQEMSFPDPTVKYTYFGESVETRVGPQQNKYGGKLKIPFPAKLGLKGRAQARQADMSKEKYEAARREVIKNVKFQYYDIYWVEQAIEITEQEKSVVERVEKVAQRKYEVNRSGQQDVIRAQIELSKFIDKLLRLKRYRKTLVARLNDILSRPQGTDIKISPELDLPEFNYDLDGLRKETLASRQELLAAKIGVEKAKYERSLAQLDYIPDFTVGFDYIQVGKGYTNMPNDGQDAWMTTFSINVPLWFDRLSSQVREKKALLEARTNSMHDIQNRVLYEVEDVYYKILTYRDIIALYKSALVPQTKQAMEATRTGYETGHVNFIDWLDSERVLLQTRLAYYKAIVDYVKSIAFMERIVGKDL